jgi:integrase
MLFKFARLRGYVHRDHQGVAPITRPTTVPREIRVFTPAECQKLLLGLPATMVPAAAIGCFTAIRSAEIERLDWSQVNLEQGHIEIMASKAKKGVRRIVPIPGNLTLWLTPFVQASGQVCSYYRLSNQWNKFAERAGVKWTRNVHRDSGISYAVALRRNVAEVALDSGNSPQVIMSNYLKAVTETEAKKWFAIEPPKDWKTHAGLEKAPVCQATSMESQERKIVEKAA